MGALGLRWDGDGGGGQACVFLVLKCLNRSLHTGQPKSAAWHCEDGGCGMETKSHFLESHGCVSVSEVGGKGYLVWGSHLLA